MLEPEGNDKSLALALFYINIPERPVNYSLAKYEEVIDGGDSSPPINEVEDNDSNRSDSLSIEKTRNRRPPVRFGIDDYVPRPK